MTIMSLQSVSAVRLIGTGSYCHTAVHLMETELIIGRHACVHCKRVGDRTLIGIDARVLDSCEIGNDNLSRSQFAATRSNNSDSGILGKWVALSEPVRGSTDHLPCPLDGYHWRAILHVWQF